MTPIRRASAIRRPRRAVTLIEVLLVLAVLVLLAATAWPSLERSLADHRLRHAADMVRAEWAQARTKAMSSSSAYRFCYVPEEQRYWVEPCDGGGAPLTGAISAQGSDAAAAEPRPGDCLLPKGIVFAEGTVCDDAAQGTPISETRADGSAQTDAPVTFFPDGTCSSAQLVLRNEHERGIAVSIRGLTAASSVGEIFQIDEER